MRYQHPGGIRKRQDKLVVAYEGELRLGALEYFGIGSFKTTFSKLCPRGILSQQGRRQRTSMRKVDNVFLKKKNAENMLRAVDFRIGGCFSPASSCLLVIYVDIAVVQMPLKNY